MMKNKTITLNNIPVQLSTVRFILLLGMLMSKLQSTGRDHSLKLKSAFFLTLCSILGFPGSSCVEEDV